MVRKNWLVFVGVAVGTYAIALPRVAPASVSETTSASECDGWTRNDYTIWDCAMRNAYPSFYLGDFAKVYFDLLHKPGKTVTVSIVRHTYAGTLSIDTKDVVLSSGASPVAKEYSVTPSEVLKNASQWDYVYAWIGGAEDVYGTVVVLK